MLWHVWSRLGWSPDKSFTWAPRIKLISFWGKTRVHGFDPNLPYFGSIPGHDFWGIGSCQDEFHLRRSFGEPYIILHIHSRQRTRMSQKPHCMIQQRRMRWQRRRSQQLHYLEGRWKWGNRRGGGGLRSLGVWNRSGGANTLVVSIIHQFI